VNRSSPESWCLVAGKSFYFGWITHELKNQSTSSNKSSSIIGSTVCFGRGYFVLFGRLPEIICDFASTSLAGFEVLDIPLNWSCRHEIVIAKQTKVYNY
jgi:hypothetical protein